MTKINYPGYKEMWEVGKLTSLCLEELKYFIVPEVSTFNINRYVYNFQAEHHLGNAQFGYSFSGRHTPFPGYCCTSVNHVICHGIPSDKILKEGDIVKVDITFIKDGWHGDSCRTYEVGKVGVKAQKVSDAAKSALWLGISQCHPGKTVGDIARVIDEYIRSINMSVVPHFTGHGIGKNFHQAPWISHWYEKGLSLNDTVLIPGMIFTIEPMINIGKPDYKILNDGWTVVSRDKTLSAQWEHTIGITDDYPIIFTVENNEVYKSKQFLTQKDFL